MNHSLSVRPVNRYKIKQDTGKEFRELDFGAVPQNLQEEYWMYMKEFNQI